MAGETLEQVAPRTADGKAGLESESKSDPKPPPGSLLPPSHVPAQLLADASTESPAALVQAALDAQDAALKDVLTSVRYPLQAYDWVHEACVASLATAGVVVAGSLRAGSRLSGGNHVIVVQGDALPEPLRELLTGPFVQISTLLYMRRATTQMQTRAVRLFADVAAVAGLGIRYGISPCIRLLGVVLGVATELPRGRRLPDGNMYCNVKKAGA